MNTPCVQSSLKISSIGYGFRGYQGKTRAEHRIIWIETFGEIPKGMVIDHNCHNEAVTRGECIGGADCPHRACINIEHLRLITQRENVMAGIHNIDHRTHCRKGHPFIKENIMTRKNGWRECAECNRVRSRAVWAKKKVVA